MKKYLAICAVLIASLVIFTPINANKSTDIQKKYAGIETTVKDSQDTKDTKVVTHVTLTCYQPVAAQCNADYLHTADNSFIDLKKLKRGELKWVAISQDLLWLIPMGSKVKITDEKTGKCYGTFTVKDKMNKRWNHRMDILIHPNSPERIYAENIKVEVV